ncbi:uncharacterized protein LOC6544955 [Drosophila erecta]|uniref:Uncharacterized protein n=1 Tax=Drosophila erecta TaxID=7220 RepID=B3NHD5_DROER|nr:uncharacterized protein LOC6544955 [Drosophila erecta]EDV51661.1 uncharacterized protein Dere_GG15633 [Drosophila erecta]
MTSEEDEVYTEEETDEALFFIREHDLPMSELHYALKYVRILNGNRSQSDQIMQAQDASLIPVAEVAPPPFDWEDKENQPVARDS